jgi:hypothetical protein
MATTRTTGARPPEKKIGPFAGGIGVAIWLNAVESGDGSPFPDGIGDAGNLGSA